MSRVTEVSTPPPPSADAANVGSGALKGTRALIALLGSCLLKCRRAANATICSRAARMLTHQLYAAALCTGPPQATVCADAANIGSGALKGTRALISLLGSSLRTCGRTANATICSRAVRMLTNQLCTVALCVLTPQNLGRGP